MSSDNGTVAPAPSKTREPKPQWVEPAGCWSVYDWAQYIGCTERSIRNRIAEGLIDPPDVRLNARVTRWTPPLVGKIKAKIAAAGRRSV